MSKKFNFEYQGGDFEKQFSLLSSRYVYGVHDVLIHAVAENEFHLVKYAIENGANVEAWDNYCLRWASSEGFFEIVKYLVQQGADVQSSYNVSLQSACFYGYFEIVKFLISSGARVTKYCLIDASKKSRSEILTFLLSHFICDLRLKRNLFLLLEQRDFTEIISLLK